MSTNDGLDTFLSGLITQITEAVTKKAIAEVTNQLKPNTEGNSTKFFNLDGSPAKDIQTNREDLIHIQEVHDAFDQVTMGAKNKPTIKNIELANNPKAITPNTDTFGLTEVQRAWLLGYIFCVEGGYFNHPNDPGGETMYGIIKSRAREYGYKGPMKDLPKEVAINIYLKKYWQAFKLDEITDFKKALCIFDFVVNSGTRGILVAQKVVNKILKCRGKFAAANEKYGKLNILVEDGKMGPNTIKAINTIDWDDFVSIYYFVQEDTYEDLMNKNTKLRSFDEGWENRIAMKVLIINEMKRQGL